MKKHRTLFSFFFSAALVVMSGCASYSSEIAEREISSATRAMYAGLNCVQTKNLLGEKRRLLDQAKRKQDSVAAIDTLTTAVSLVPAASLLGANSETQVAILKGEVSALTRFETTNCARRANSNADDDAVSESESGSEGTVFERPPEV